MAEQIELQINADDNGQPYITDQHGRTIKGVTHISISASVGDITTISIDAYAYSKGRHVVGGPIKRDMYHIDISGPDTK